MSSPATTKNSPKRLQRSRAYGKYLADSGGSFYFRIAVPPALRAIFRQREIKRSLHTTDRREAQGRSSYMASVVLVLFRKYSALLLQFSSGNTLDIQALNLHCQNDVEKLFKLVAASSPAEVVQPSIQNAFGNIKPKVLSKTLSQLFAEYAQSALSSQRWKSTSLKDYNAAMEALIEIQGDVDISQITPTCAKDIFELVRRLPKNRKKDPRYRDLSLRSVIALKPEPMSDTTANKYMNRISTVFQFAHSLGYITNNPFNNNFLRVKETGLKQQKRQHFSEEELRQLFSGDVFTEAARKHDTYYWVTLLLLHTGARLDEICQLHVKDVQQIKDIWVIHHSRCVERKSFKSRSAKVGEHLYDTPLHEDVLKLGFLDYVEHIKQRQVLDEYGDQLLFPDLKYCAKHGYGRKVSRWFNDNEHGRSYKARCSIAVSASSGMKDLHSFRHTFATQAQRADVPESLAYQLTGHSQGGRRAGGLYRKGHEIERLKEAIDKASFVEALATVRRWQPS